VLGGADGPYSLAAYMSTAAELLKGRLDTVAANRVHWGSHSALVAAVSHFPEQKIEQEVLRSECSVNLTEDKVDALLIRVCMDSNLLASHVPSLVSHNPPDITGELWW
jgi:hypothetical protein